MKRICLLFGLMFLFTNCSSENDYNPFSDCESVDNPEEVILGKWKYLYASTSNGKKEYSPANDTGYLEYLSNGTLLIRGEDAFDADYSINDTYLNIPNSPYTSYFGYGMGNCIYKYCFANNTNTLTIQLTNCNCIRVGTLENYVVFVYERIE